jgi:hypothetical protein
MGEPKPDELIYRQKHWYNQQLYAEWYENREGQKQGKEYRYTEEGDLSLEIPYDENGHEHGVKTWFEHGIATTRKYYWHGRGMSQEMFEEFQTNQEMLDQQQRELGPLQQALADGEQSGFVTDFDPQAFKTALKASISG